MIVTLEDQMTVIHSHLASVERQKNKGDWDSLAVFLEGISGAALLGAEYCRGKAEIAKAEAKPGETA